MKTSELLESYAKTQSDKAVTALYDKFIRYARSMVKRTIFEDRRYLVDEEIIAESALRMAFSYLVEGDVKKCRKCFLRILRRITISQSLSSLRDSTRKRRDRSNTQSLHGPNQVPMSIASSTIKSPEELAVDLIDLVEFVLSKSQTAVRRDIGLLYFLEGMPTEFIADRMNLTLRSIQLVIARQKQLIAQEIDKLNDR